MSILARLRRPTPQLPTRQGKPGVIGLDIGANTLNLCQLHKLTDNSFEIIAKSNTHFSQQRSELLESPRDFKQVMKKATAGKHFKGNKVVAIVPPDKVKNILLSYNAKVSDIDQEILSLVEQRVEGSIDDYVIDYMPVRNAKNDDEHVVMASVSLRDDINHLLNLLTDSGLEVQALDIGPAALRRLVSTMSSSDQRKNFLIINFGDERTYLTIISGRRLLFDQPINFGATELINEVATALDLPVERARELIHTYGMDESLGSSMSAVTDGTYNVASTLVDILNPKLNHLVEEINRMLVFTASETHGEPLSQVLMLGSIARWPGAMQKLLSHLGMSSTTSSHLNFHQIFHDASDMTVPLPERLPELAIATGLALRGLDDND